jgi:hypothetical protein
MLPVFKICLFLKNTRGKSHKRITFFCWNLSITAPFLVDLSSQAERHASACSILMNPNLRGDATLVGDDRLPAFDWKSACAKEWQDRFLPKCRNQVSAFKGTKRKHHDPSSLQIKPKRQKPGPSLPMNPSDKAWAKFTKPVLLATLSKHNLSQQLPKKALKGQMISLLVTNNIEPSSSEAAAPPRCKNKTVHHALVGHSNPHHLRSRKRKAPITTKPPKKQKKLSSFIPSSNPNEQRESVASTLRPLFKELQTEMQEFTRAQLQPMHQRLEMLEKDLQGSHPTDPIGATTPQPLQQLSQMPNVPFNGTLPPGQAMSVQGNNYFFSFPATYIQGPTRSQQQQ